MDIGIVDTGCANLASVKFALDRLGVDSKITQDADEIYGAPRVLIPGVGAAGYAMDRLRERELIPVLQNLTQPVMGICLGMQMLFDSSTENDGASCLGLVPGQVQKLDTGSLPSPHMGWNTLENLTDDPLLTGIKAGDYVYFVHSFAAPISDMTIASANYGDSFTAIVRQGNIYGCQFHPERSGETGARILKNFIELD